MLPLMEYERVQPDYIYSQRGSCVMPDTSSLVTHSHYSQALPRSQEHRAMGDDGGGAKLATTGLKQIVRLRELLHKWHAMAMGAKQQQQDEEDEVPSDAEAASAIPPFVLRRLQRTVTADSDDESCHSPEPPPDVPKGYCPVYVGPEQRRFVIPTSYLSHPVFRLLLEKAEEFGFRHEGALAIPCETEAFKYILQCVERHDKGLAADGT
jgi:SAUR family protein